MAMICVVSWGIRPIFRLISYLVSSPRLARTRLRATSVVVGLFVVVISFLALLPFPNRFRAPGVIESVEHLRMVNDVSGYVEEVLALSGTMVQTDTILMKLSDKELDLEIQAGKAQREETLALKLLAISESKADLKPILKRLDTIESRLKDLRKKNEALTVRAKRSGLWVSPQSHELVGTWIMRGSAIGEIVPQETFRFSAIVSQDEASNLFADRIEKGEVRLFGQGDVNLEVGEFQIIPFQHEQLPSAALGWYGGGEVAVSASDQTGLKAAEPFFQIYAELKSIPEVALFHGRSGRLRFSMHPKPLLMQWNRKLRQLLHKRYQI